MSGQLQVDLCAHLTIDISTLILNPQGPLPVLPTMDRLATGCEVVLSKAAASILIAEGAAPESLLVLRKLNGGLGTEHPRNREPYLNPTKKKLSKPEVHVYICYYKLNLIDQKPRVNKPPLNRAPSIFRSPSHQPEDLQPPIFGWMNIGVSL